MTTPVYNQSGEETGNITLPEALFSAPFNSDLLHHVVQAARHNARQPVAHTKDRRARRGGGKKPWRQKGTGRARHGSIRSPIWRGGGVTFGPSNQKNFKKKVNKNTKRRALASALSAKHDDGEILFVDQLNFSEPSTAEAKDFLAQLSKASEQESLSTKSKNASLVVLPERDEATELSFRNFSNIKVCQASSLNALWLLTYKFVIIVDPETVIDALSARVQKATSGKTNL